MGKAWSVHDVYFLTEGEDGPVAIPNLTLTFLPSGVALAKADGRRVWRSSWARLEAMWPVERSVLPDGRDGVVIAVVQRGVRRQSRLVLPTDDAGATEATIRERTAAAGLRAQTPPLSQVLTVSIAVAAVATMTVLLLSATHVIHF